MIIYILSILLNAVGDGLNNRGIKTWGHLVNALFILLLILAPMFYSVTYLYIICYILYRIALFDIVYNLARGNKWWYIGNSNWWDRIWSKCPIGFLMFFRIIMLTTAISITIQYL